MCHSSNCWIAGTGRDDLRVITRQSLANSCKALADGLDEDSQSSSVPDLYRQSWIYKQIIEELPQGGSILDDAATAISQMLDVLVFVLSFNDQGEGNGTICQVIMHCA